MSLVALLIYLLIALLVVALILYAISILPDPPVTGNIKNLMKVAVILVCIILLVAWLVGGLTLGGPHVIVR